MNRRGRSRFGGSPEIYYYNSARRDAVGELAGQLSGLIQEEMTRRHKKKLVFLCIGTDRSTGDSLDINSNRNGGAVRWYSEHLIAPCTR